MAKNTLFNIGVLAVLLLSFTVVSAATSENNVSIILDKTSISNVSVGNIYSIEATIENLNDTGFYVEFRTTNWDSWDAAKNVAAGTNEDFTGVFTVPSSKPASRGAYADIYNASNHSQLLFTLSRTISLTYTSSTPDPTSSDYKYCDDFSGEHGHLEIVEFDVINNGKGDDTEWEYLDEIEIEVTVENTGNDNINNVMVEIKILDEDDNTITKRKMNLNDDSIDLGRIKDDDEETAIFKINEVPIDLENGDYRIYVRAYEDGNEEEECTSTSSDFTNDDETYFEFEIVQNDGSTVIVKENLENIQASCGDKDIEVRVMVYNTGDNDEDKVLVMLENYKLGISEKYIIDNLRDKKGKEAVFYITIPDKVDKSFAELDIYTYYDYDDDEDELDELVAYGESSEEEGDGFSIGLEILSCQTPSKTTIAINLESETVIGEQVVIKAIITNEGEDSNFVISTSGLESWAESITISPLTASINKGESTEATITFVPTRTGEQTFKINTISNGQTTSQSAVINIKEKPSILSGISNTMLYIIAGIALILILIFLILIVKVSRRQVKPQF